MDQSKCVARVAGLTATVLLSVSASAQSTATLSQLNRPSGIDGPSVNEYLLNPTTPMVRSIADPYGSASSYGEAEFGVLKASATAHGDALPYGRFFARSYAEFTDNFTFTSGGLLGSSGFMNATLVFQRSLSVEGNAVDGYATAQLHAGTNFWAYDYIETYMLQPSGLTLTSQTGNGADSATWLDSVSVSLKVPITFGSVNSFTARIDMSALAGFYSSGPGVDGKNAWMADAAHSLYWGGITSVTDASGNPVEYTLTAASGTDYLQSFVPVTTPVPEPETYALMLAGLLALGVLRRNRRSCGALH